MSQTIGNGITIKTVPNNDSGKVNNAEIDVRIETEGRFYLVFDNLFSGRPKEVTVDVSYAFVPTD